MPLNHNNWLPWQRPSAPQDPHLTHDSLGPFESTAQTANPSVQPFLHSSQHKVHKLYNGGPFPPKLPLLVRDGDPIIFMIPEADRAHNPNCITIGSASFAQVTAECPCTLQWAPLSSKIAPSYWGSGPPYKTRFLGPIRAHRPNAISIGSAVFPQTTVECPYTLQWDAHSLPKICPSHGGSEPSSNTWSLGFTQVLNPNGILIGSAAFAGLISVTDRQTDRPTDKPTNHATRSLTIDRIYVPSTAMRSNNNNLTKNKQSVKET